VDGTRSLSFSPGSPLPGYAKGFPNLGNQDAQLAQFQARIAELENLLKEKVDGHHILRATTVALWF